MSAEPQPAAGAAFGSARADAQRESCAFQRAILECADYSIISTTPDGVIRTFNRAAERMLGYCAEEVIGRVTPEIIHDYDEVVRRAAKLTEELGRPVAAGFEAFVARACEGLTDEQEWTYIRKDGSRFPVQLSVTAMRDEAGEIIGFMGIAQDISPRRSAQARVGQLTAQLDRRVRQRTAQLSASEERLRLAQQAARVGTFEWNIQTGTNTWSPELEAMYGLPPGGFPGTQPAWENLVHPDDLARAKAQVQRAFDTTEPVEGEWRVVWPDGSTHWLFGRFQVFRDAAGQPVRLAGVNLDITARKEAEQKLAETARFPGENPHPVLRVTRDGRISFANPASRDLLASWACGVGDALPKSLLEVAATALASGRRTSVNVSCGDRVLAFTVAPIVGGGYVNFYGQDITELKRAEEALRQARDELEVRVQERTAELARLNLVLRTEVEDRKAAEEEVRVREEQLRDLFENATDLIQSVAPDGRILFVNRAWLNTLGYRMGELAALTVFDIIHPDCLGECREHFARVMRGEALTGFEAIFRAKDGRKIFVEGNASARFEDGRPVATRGIFRDISKRKAVEAERERLIAELQAALAEVKTLSGLLPVCGWCKKIRDDSGYWNSVEGYLKKSSGMDITHGICPDCQAKMMVELDQITSERAAQPPPSS